MRDLASGRILVCLPNWVGDVVMATPVLKALRRGFPAASIAHMGRPAPLAVADGVDWSDETIAVDPAAGGMRLLALASQIRRGRYDLGILLPNSFRVAALARLGGVTELLGYARDGRGWLLHRKLLAPQDGRGRFLPVPMIDYYRRLAEALGLGDVPRTMRLGIRAEDGAAAERLLAEVGADNRRPLVMLNPGASFGSSKMWELDRWAALADALIERRDAQILINASPAERRIVSQVALRMQHVPAIDFASRDNRVGLLKALVKRCALVITGDTGVRHIGAALGTGVVTLFGSTDPVWSQIDYPRERIIRVDVPCSPCQRKRCRRGAGPLYHVCMAAITVEMALAQAEALLDGEKTQ